MSAANVGLLLLAKDRETSEEGLIELDGEQALALAQMLKRIGFTEWRVLSASREELDAMREACGLVQRALAGAGWAPR